MAFGREIRGNYTFMAHWVVSVAALLLATPSVAIADWPTYGHDLSNTRDAGLVGPAPSQVPTMTQTWKFSSSTGDFTGTPVVAGGVLVAGNNGGWVYALDAATGKLLWSRNVGAPVNGSAAIDLSAPGGPTVFVPVAEVGSPHLAALSLSSGATRWDTTLTTWPGADVYGSPVFWRGTVYIGVSAFQDNSTVRGSLLSLGERGGQIRWQTYTVPPGRDGAPIWSTPAIDTRTGRLYAGTGNNYHSPTTDTEDAIMAFDASTGAILGSYQATSGDVFSESGNVTGPDADFGDSPNLITSPSGEQLVGDGQKTGIYWALDRATMQPAWHATIGPGWQFGGIIGATASDSSRIYGADATSGQVFGLRTDGSLAWESVDAGGAHVSPAAIGDGVLYTVDPTGFLVARQPDTGLLLGRFPLGGFALGGASVVGQAVYVAVGTSELPQQLGGSIIAFGRTSLLGPSG